MCSVYEPERVFTLDRSLLPGRVYHEKGATRWYTKRELLPAKASKNPAKPLTQEQKRTLQGVRSSAFLAIVPPSPSLPFRCTECGVRFTRKSKAPPLKPGQFPFCSTAHRVRYWKRKNLPEKALSTNPQTNPQANRLQKGVA